MNRTHSNAVKTYSVYRINDLDRMTDAIKCYESGEWAFKPHGEDRTTERLEQLRRDIILLTAGVITQTSEFRREEWLPKTSASANS